jgi:hypothetical protein
LPVKIDCLVVVGEQDWDLVQRLCKLLAASLVLGEFCHQVKASLRSPLGPVAFV